MDELGNQISRLSIEQQEPRLTYKDLLDFMFTIAPELLSLSTYQVSEISVRLQNQEGDYAIVIKLWETRSEPAKDAVLSLIKERAGGINIPVKFDILSLGFDSSSFHS